MATHCIRLSIAVFIFCCLVTAFWSKDKETKEVAISAVHHSWIQTWIGDLETVEAWSAGAVAPERRTSIRAVAGLPPLVEKARPTEGTFVKQEAAGPVEAPFRLQR